VPCGTLCGHEFASPVAVFGQAQTIEPRRNRVLIKGRFITIAASAIGVSALSQTLGFLRQLLVAAFFGISRELDIFLVVFAVANMIVFTFGVIFDSVVVARLVQLREKSGDEAACALASTVFRLSCLLGVAASLAMLAVLPLLTPIVATGFNPAERSELLRLAWYFLPWTLLFVPYYAAAARHKGKRSFTRVFAAEIVIGGVSILCLALWHGAIESLPLAYAAGYAAALVSLLPGAGLIWPFRRQSPRQVLRNIGELFLANQAGSLANLTDRHFQSLIPAGGIAAVGYSTQLVNGLSALLVFREIFVVPLSETERRAEKLERLVIGLVLLATPVAAFTAFFAHEVVQILYGHGRFDAAAIDLTSRVLGIYAWTLLTSSLITPLLRMFQIVDRIGFTYIAFLSSTAFLAGFGYLFVIALGLGAPGVAWMLLGNSILGLGVIAYLVARCGIAIGWWRVSGYFIFAAAASGLAALAALASASPIEAPGLRLLAGGAAFAAVVGGAYFAARGRLRRIIF
jgi:putative peptidoglycan lipid II flippase